MDLLEADLIEVTHFGQGNLYRLSERSKSFFASEKKEVNRFHLTQTFNLLIDFDCRPNILFQIGEIAEFVQCSHHNTFKITQESIQRSIERGWKRDSILEFLKENSINGLPLNVEQTIREWCSHQGDVEFHAITLITVVPNQIQRFESLREFHPYLLHRFSPGLYAVDVSRLEQLTNVLKERGLIQLNYSPPTIGKCARKVTITQWMKTVHLEWSEQRETSSHISKISRT